MNFEIFITNVQGANKIKDFTRDEYIKSINYFEKIYGSYKIDNFYSFYKIYFSFDNTQILPLINHDRIHILYSLSLNRAKIP